MSESLGQRVMEGCLRAECRCGRGGDGGGNCPWEGLAPRLSSPVNLGMCVN